MRWKPILWSKTAPAHFHSIKLSPDGKLIASASFDGATKTATLILWDTKTGEVHGEPFGKNEGLYNSIEFSPSGDYLAALGHKGRLSFWSITTRKQLIKCPTEGAQTVCSFGFSASGNEIVKAYFDCTFAAWTLNTEVPKFKNITTNTPISCLRYSPDERYIVAGLRDGQIQVLEAESGNAVGERLSDGHQRVVMHIGFSSDGKFFISSSYDDTLRL